MPAQLGFTLWNATWMLSWDFSFRVTRPGTFFAHTQTFSRMRLDPELETSYRPAPTLRSKVEMVRDHEESSFLNHGQVKQAHTTD